MMPPDVLAQMTISKINAGVAAYECSYYAMLATIAEVGGKEMALEFAKEMEERAKKELEEWEKNKITIVIG